MAWISFGALRCRKTNLMTTRVSMLLKSRTSLTCFRNCFLPARAKDLSAPGRSVCVYTHKYRVIKRSLCTWFLYCNHQVRTDFLMSMYIYIYIYIYTYTYIRTYTHFYKAGAIPQYLKIRQPILKKKIQPAALALFSEFLSTRPN